MPTVSNILIANRGEIAVRIARTAKALGCQTVAVYSEADRDALHVDACDTAVAIGPAPAAESYLKIDAIIEAARIAGADAVHPGYGFLSENAAFADAVEQAGLTFIGPPAAAIAAMGNKAAAKRRMIEAGVPCVPGYQGTDQSDSTLIREAERIGLPVMVKAAAGGGGRGMRLVTRREDLSAALVGARSEAERAFGSGELILEKAVIDARHVEIQVFGDTHGDVIHLGERDCSVQRRHQKVIEEAPSPAVSPELRARMGAAAVTAAKSIGYVGAGTVEFLLGADGAFYFLEMNTRLQVEHPVTEMVTGYDLVAWQIHIARGEPLPIKQSDARMSGHAMEVRLYAEDPAAGFLPQSGDVLLWQPPLSLRVDGGLKCRDRVSPFYDPMIAKLGAHGATRDEARRRLVAGLEQARVLGITTNQSFLIDLLSHPEFVAGRATTGFIGQYFSAPTRPRQRDATATAIMAALLLDASSEIPQGALAGWSSTGALAAPVLLEMDDGKPATRLDLDVLGDGRFRVHDGTSWTDVEVLATGAPEARRVTVNGRTETIAVAEADGVLYVGRGAATFTCRDLVRAPRAGGDGETGSELRAPMNGRIVRIGAKAGDVVRKGQCIVVLEAMKMQHEIAAPRDGMLARLVVTEGQQVATRALLAEVG